MCQVLSVHVDVPSANEVSVSYRILTPANAFASHTSRYRLYIIYYVMKLTYLLVHRYSPLLLLPQHTVLWRNQISTRWHETVRAKVREGSPGGRSETMMVGFVKK